MSLSALGVSDLDKGLEKRLSAAMSRIEDRLAASVECDTAFVTEAARHLITAGGKRFRPLLVVMAGEFGDPTVDAVIEAALVVELTHLATLYHDDVMDEADMRRGADSANVRYGNTVAILTGDFLFAQASTIVTGLGVEAVRIQSETFARLVQGQIRETAGPAAGEDPLEHYLSVVADKTGSLIATSARFGAMLSGADEEVTQRLTEFGELIGIAFQLSDDIIDVASDTSDLGKASGTDLREGVPTLPTLLARQSHHPTDHRLIELLSGPITDEARHAEALRLLRSNPAMAKARQEVRERADAARELLSGVPAIAARDALLSLCDVVTTRSA